MTSTYDPAAFVKDPARLINLCREVIAQIEIEFNDPKFAEKEVQLREIAKAVERLGKTGVPVPDMLRAEKTRLAAELSSKAEGNQALAYLSEGFEAIVAELNHRLGKNRAINKNIRTETKVFSEDDLLNGIEGQIREAYMLIKQIVYQVNPDVEERIKKTMICFYTGGKGLIWVAPTKRNIRIFLRKGNYRDRDGKMIPEGWGNYPELQLAASEMDAVFVRQLIEQANNIGP